MNDPTLNFELFLIHVCLLCDFFIKLCRYKFHRESASSGITEGELYSIISNLKDAGYTVIATVADMGGGNQGFFNKLGVTDEEPWFEGLKTRIFTFSALNVCKAYLKMVLI